MCSYVRSEADHYSLAVTNSYNILRKQLPFEQPCVHMCVQRLAIIRWPSLILTISSKTTSVRAAKCSYVHSEADHYSLAVSNPYNILKNNFVRAAKCSYVHSEADHYSLAVSNPYNILKDNFRSSSHVFICAFRG